MSADSRELRKKGLETHVGTDFARFTIDDENMHAGTKLSDWFKYYRRSGEPKKIFKYTQIYIHKYFYFHTRHATMC